MDTNKQNHEKRSAERGTLPRQEQNPRAPKRNPAQETEPRSKRRLGEVVPGFGGGTPSTTPGGASGKM